MPEQVNHLDDRRRVELLRVLDEFAVCFSDKPGLCDVVTHRIVTTSEFAPKQMRPYRVPVAFRTEMNLQIRELLDRSLIRPYIRDCAPKSAKLLRWSLALKSLIWRSSTSGVQITL